MSIKLRFEKGSFSGQVVLKDGAWPELQRVINENQADDESLSPLVEKILPKGDAIPDLNDPSKEQERMNFVRASMLEQSEAEALSKIPWETFSEQILILGALIEVNGGEPGWRNADIEDRFRVARKQPPANFAREISNAIKAGIIATVTPRTYRVSKTGWLKIYEGILKSAVVRPPMASL